MKAFFLYIGARAIEHEPNFFARVRLAVKFLEAWGTYGKRREVSGRSA